MFSAAQEKPVRVPFSCAEGSAFTIKIPVKFPENTTVQYAWYRNDTLIEDSHKLLMSNEKAIAYTVPADKAFGSSVAFHFTYCLDDECSDVWTRSPTYIVDFRVFLPPQVAAITGDTLVCAGISATYSTTYIAGAYYMWFASPGWTITAGQNTHSITVTAGAESGFVLVTPANSSGVGATRTLAVAVTSVTSPGVASVADYTCNSDIISAGVASVDDYSCSDVSSAGVASVEAYSCTSDIISAGVISVEAY